MEVFGSHMFAFTNKVLQSFIRPFWRKPRGCPILPAQTIGNDGDRAEIRLEYYKQTPNGANQPQGIANLEAFDLYPDLDAFIFQFNYYF